MQRQAVQVIPSGPGRTGNGIYQLLLLSIYSAQHEMVITTPYFVPDDAVSTALLTAAERGRRYEFMDLRAGCCTPKALWWTGKLPCSARSI
jgi:phosphatidylserine/phosphatidylglycerophosphate/cardiolipin synthase-like enzyme